MDVPQLLSASVGVPDLPWQLVAGIFVLTTTLVVATRKRLSKQRQFTAPRARIRARTQARTQAAQAKTPHRRAIENDMREVLLEMEKLARQVNAQIENKYQKLEVVIRDADVRLAELRSLLSTGTTAQTPHALDVTVGAEVEACAPASLDPNGPNAADADGVAICAAAHAGRSAAQIAEQFKRPVGEIELVLSLHHAETSKI